MTTMEALIRPEGWLAGYRAFMVPATPGVLAVLLPATGTLSARTPIGAGIVLLLVAAAVLSGVGLAYAAAGKDPRPQPVHHSRPSAGSGGDDMLGVVLNEIHLVENRIMEALRLGREEHAKEHGDLNASIQPLIDDLHCRQEAHIAHEARVGPIKSAALFLWDNWAKVAAILAALGIFLAALGIDFAALWEWVR
jgi:hypothetical protein